MMKAIPDISALRTPSRRPAGIRVRTKVVATWWKYRPVKLPYLLILGMAAAFARPAGAFPLSQASFDRLALACAPSTALATLRAVAQVESRFEPLAIRDNSTREAWTPANLAAAVTLAEDKVKRGHSLDLGIMQINSANLPSLGIGLADAFDPCRSVNAAQRILLSDAATGNSETEHQAAILITLSRYNTGRPLAGIANGYVDRVLAAQKKFPASKLERQDASNIAPQWDIWGTSGAAPSSWVITANTSYEIERAGAQTSDARNEGRAPASQSEKGEPYELSAYQESGPNRP